MPFEQAMDVTGRLMTQVQALAAITARLDLIDRGAPGDPAIRAELDNVAGVLGVRDAFDDLEPQERKIVLSFARSYLRQAIELVDDPARAGAWSHTDPAILQAQGQASGVIATLLDAAGYNRPNLRILDVGCGVAGLSVAFCKVFAGSSVVGVDPWEPALALARKNIADAGLGDRITLVAGRVEDLDDDTRFDLVWLPTFFIPEPVLDAAIGVVHRVTDPGGTAVLGSFAAPEDPLSAATDNLVTVRSGGSVLSPAETQARLERAGFSDAHEIERTWMAPIRLVVGTRA